MVPGGFASEATEIFHEGLRVPPVRIKKRGKDVDEVWKLLLANVRTPRYNYGDYRAMISACELGAQRMTGVIRKYGVPLFPANRRRPHGLFRIPDAGGDRGDPRRPVLLRGLHGG